MTNYFEHSGQRIRAARIARGITQQNLAEAIGVSRSAVAQWETGRAGQLGSNLSRIAAVLGVPAGQLLEGDAPDGTIEAENGTEIGLLRLFRDLTEDDQALLLRVAVRMSRRLHGED